MSQCLRCHKPCAPEAIVCDQCRIDLNISSAGQTLKSVDNNVSGGPFTPIPESLDVTQESFSSSEEQESFPASSHSTVPMNSLPTPSLTQDLYATQPAIADQSLNKLNDAARLIAASEQELGSSITHRAPRVARLSPLHDISADIRRESTPLPKAFVGTNLNQRTVPEKPSPDPWFWLQEPEIDETDVWSDHTDPLLARRLPSNAEIARIEKEDMRRIFSFRHVALPSFLPQKRTRILFIALTIFALLALTIDTVLLSVAYINKQAHFTAKHTLPPTLTLVTGNATGNAVMGQKIPLHLTNFTPSAYVRLTRDIEESVYLNTANPVLMSADGSANIILTIENSWDSGSHTIEAEDITTRYTASTTIQITSGQPRPAHLSIGTSQLNFPADAQGTNTIQQVALNNSGSGTITWSASSDKPWLLITPNQGIFSDSQIVSVAAQRTNLEPGDYTGTITLSSNVGGALLLPVHMSVRPLPDNVTAVLSVTPAVLSYSAVDGYSDPKDQFLEVSNLGTQLLYWSISANSSVAQPGMSSQFEPSQTWLSPEQTSGIVVPATTSLIRVRVHSHALLPGTYTSNLIFASSAGHQAYNSPQMVSVSLTVQRRCSATLSTGTISFTAVSGQANPNSQSLSLSLTASCVGATTWDTSSSVSWFSVSPASGKLQGVTNAVTTVNVNTAGLTPGKYTGILSFNVAKSSTQSVTIQLVVQAPPLPKAPILGISTLSLNFSTTLGQPTPPGQILTITNTGGSTLFWNISISPLASSWLNLSQPSGIVPPGQTGQLAIGVNTNGLTPGNYMGQITLFGTNSGGVPASGSSQTITVNFTVLQPCTLSQPTSSMLAFSSTQGQADPASQLLIITASGSCNWPVNWNTSQNPAVSWLKLTPASGNFAASGQVASLIVAPTMVGLAPNKTYTTQVSITAVDASGLPLAGNSQVFTVALTVLQPCTLQSAKGNLNFSVGQGQATPSQNLSFGETGNCTSTVTWTANAPGTNWLTLSASAGSDTGSGSSVDVGINTAVLAPGTYKGAVTLTASGSAGAVVLGSPLSIPVTLTVTGYTVGGTTTYACTNPCAPAVFPATVVTLLDSTNAIVGGPVTADANGNFSFNNVPNGIYTLSATGKDILSIAYSSSITVTVAGGKVTANLALDSH